MIICECDSINREFIVINTKLLEIKINYYLYIIFSLMWENNERMNGMIRMDESGDCFWLETCDNETNRGLNFKASGDNET